MEANVVTHTCDGCGEGDSPGEASDDQRRPRRAADEADAFSAAKSEFSASGRRRTVPCRVCKKNFRSMKALAGHMRCHPEREWRGIHPPGPGPADNHDQDEDNLPAGDNAGDLTAALPPGWRRKESRGRAGRSSALADAADGLLGLSRGECPRVLRKRRTADPPTPPPPPLEEFPAQKPIKVREASETGTLLRITNVSAETTARMTENECLEEKKRKRCDNDCEVDSSSETETDEEVYSQAWKKIVNDNTDNNNNNNNNTDNDNDNDNHNNNNGENDDEDDDDEDDDDLLYKCIDCGKSFATFQGLGGHRSTHSKEVEKKPSSSSSSSSSSSRAVNREISTIGSAQESGQWVTGLRAGEGQEIGSARLGSRGGSGGQVVLGFDLNELPRDHDKPLDE